MPETNPATIGDAAAMHVESPAKVSSAVDDTPVAMNSHGVHLDSDELREQMAAQVKATKLKVTSRTSLQIFFFLFVAYCSKSSFFRIPPGGFAPAQRNELTRTWQIPGAPALTALSWAP